MVVHNIRLVHSSLQPSSCIEAGANVSRMRSHPHEKNLFVTAGKENDLKLWDLEKSKAPIFAAKNVSGLNTQV
jgi:ribosome biogenesis protein NSA1